MSNIEISSEFPPSKTGNELPNILLYTGSVKTSMPKSLVGDGNVQTQVYHTAVDVGPNPESHSRGAVAC